MRERPTGGELLVFARKVLREDLIGLLPDERRYDALMVANAMAIAARQLEAGEGPERRALMGLAALYDEEPTPGDVADVRWALDRLYRRLSEDIRRGTFDPGQPRREAAFDHLLKVAILNVRESNPKILEVDGIEDTGY